MSRINEKRLIDNFMSLASIDSPTYGERMVADEILRRLQALGIQAEEDRAGEALGGNSGNLIARVPGTIEASPLLFCAHMDTVEPSRGKKPVLSGDGTISSAGDTVLGADDLGGVSEILEALTVILEEGLPHRPLELVFPVAEEAYTRGSHQLDLGKLEAKEGYVLDLAGRPGGVAHQAPTILYFRATFCGKAAHAGECPERGIHAIAAAAKAVASVQNGHVDGETTVNIGTIHGGTGVNVVPESCVVEGEVRSFRHESALSRYEKIRESFLSAAGESGAKVEMEDEVRTVAYLVSEESPVYQRLGRACRKVGLSLHPVRTFGGSDANTFNEKGIHSLVVANAMYQIHTCGEYTHVQELCRAADLVLELMLDRE